MITINTVSATQFSFNGINYHKNFMPFVVGNKISIINVYDSCISLTTTPTIFSDYTVNGTTYSSVAALQAALLDVIYTRNSLLPAQLNWGAIGGTLSNQTDLQTALNAKIGGTLTTNYLPKATGSTTLGNSLVYDNGTNVGIGTTNPNGKLTIKEGAVSLEFNTGATKSEILSFDRGASAYKDLFLRGNDIVFSPLDVERLRITSSGNVGIGTTAPNSKLEVAGKLTVNSSIGSDVIASIVNTSSTGFGARFQGGGGNSGLYLAAFNDYNGNNKFLIDGSGNVGIGTTSPLTGGGAAKWLTLEGSTYSGGIIGSVNGVAKFYNYFDNASNTAALQAGSGVGVTLWTDSTERMRINSSGNVGIGTTAPSEKLDVNGLIKSSNGISVGGSGVSQVWTGTQAAYDAIATKSSTTIYFIQ